MASFDRNEIWKHNSFLGGCGMTHANLRSIQQSRTATPESRQLANQMMDLNERLKQSLRTRVDQQTTDQ